MKVELLFRKPEIFTVTEALKNALGEAAYGVFEREDIASLDISEEIKKESGQIKPI
ncbi:MAG: hypothetical protein LBS09_05775 [Bacteroidales bacterium]|jgi:hypothetical protein|nr:hypothetical protein [Bacteroidales bacterium]